MALSFKSAVRAFLFVLVAAAARPATIAGRVIDAETGATIPATPQSARAMAPLSGED
jgi:hypothetical protein